jgi:hypothetical protein
LVADK